jgi:hypothetical protein
MYFTLQYSFQTAKVVYDYSDLHALKKNARGNNPFIFFCGFRRRDTIFRPLHFSMK